ncbi:hypothetical protein AB1N83_011326 [Pleurotus pulmonarius]
MESSGIEAASGPLGLFGCRRPGHSSPQRTTISTSTFLNGPLHSGVEVVNIRPPNSHSAGPHSSTNGGSLPAAACSVGAGSWIVRFPSWRFRWFDRMSSSSSRCPRSPDMPLVYTHSSHARGKSS